METQTLIALAQQGDDAAFAALFRQHRAKVYKRCLGMLRNPSDAEDFTQEVFLKLHQTIGSFQGKSQFSTWLYKLTTNLVLMHLRSKAPVTASLDDMEREPADERAEVDPFAAESILNHLPVRLRTVFRMRVIEGYSVTETANALEVGPMAVVRRCSEAKDILRGKLAPPTCRIPGTQRRWADLIESQENGVAPPEIAGSNQIFLRPSDLTPQYNRVLSTLPLC